MLLKNPYFWLALAIMFIIIIVVGYFTDIDSGDDAYSDYYGEGTDWWWPIGSFETTTEGGILFASGDPASTAITDTFGTQRRISS